MIHIERRLVYGRPCHYPTNELAKAICEMLGRKSLSERHIGILKKHHITIEQEESTNE